MAFIPGCGRWSIKNCDHANVGDLHHIYEGTGVVAPFSLLWLPLGDLQCICSLLHLSSGELPFELSTIVKISQFPDSTWHVAAMSVLFLLLGLGKNVRSV